MDLQNVGIIKNIESQAVYSQVGLIAVPDLKKLEFLNENHLAEVLDFLKVRPVHTIVMTGFIRDNGLESELNRGKFLGYRNQNGKLEGVAPACLSKLSSELMQRVENICLLSNLKFEAAHRSFEKAGYTSRDVCMTIFV